MLRQYVRNLVGCAPTQPAPQQVKQGRVGQHAVWLEAAALKDSPLLIQKIIAERLSDKVQIMMVPMDGKFFFTNDVLKGGAMTNAAVSSGGPQAWPAPSR